MLRRPHVSACTVAGLLVALAVSGMDAPHAGAQSGTGRPPRFSITPVLTPEGTLPFGVSDAGDLAGTFQEQQPGEPPRRLAFHWKGGTGTSLPTLPGGDGVAYSVNSLGAAVGSSSAGEVDDEGAPIPHAVLWREGAVTDLGTLGGLRSEAFGINDAGQVVGWAETAEGDTRAFLWENGTMTALPTLDETGGSSYAFAINNAGQVVGSSRGSTGTGEPGPVTPVLWQAGTIMELGLDGAGSGSAYGINGLGHIVGTLEFEGYSRGFVWRSGTLTQLRTLGGPNSSASSISDAGIILGRADSPLVGPVVACLWKDDVPYYFSTLAPAGTSVRDAIDVSPNGNVAGVITDRSADLFDTGALLTPDGVDDGAPALGALLTTVRDRIGGRPGKGLVVLSGVTDSHQGIQVRLRSSNPKLLRVPRSVRVKPRKSTALFRFTTKRVRRFTPVTVTAEYNGTKLKELVILVPPFNSE